MSSATIGFIGAGRIGQALARKCVKAGYPVIVSNRRGPQSLGDLVAELGPLAAAGIIAEAAQADIIFLTVRWVDLPQVGASLPSLAGKIVVDVTNPILPDGSYVDLGQSSSSEQVASQLPGSRLIKAFNTLYAAWLEAEPVQPAGRRVVFVSGDDAAAKQAVLHLIAALGFAPVDLGSLREGGWLQQAGRPLAALNLLQVNPVD